VKLSTTACASSGVPSWNSTPSFRVKSYCVPSSEIVHEVASQGTTLPSSCSETRESRYCRAT
jgi:hypothetical protein